MYFPRKMYFSRIMFYLFLFFLHELFCEMYPTFCIIKNEIYILKQCSKHFLTKKNKIKQKSQIICNNVFS